MSPANDDRPVAVTLAEWIAAVEAVDLPAAVVTSCADTIIDTYGLAFAARRSGYVTALLESWPGDGPCTVIGSQHTRDAGTAAMINGTAAHGEDFDNTFEGCPVHPGSVIVPAVLAIAEEQRLGGSDALRGIAVGQELMCRLGLAVQKGVHAAGFHPTAVIGAMGATAAVATATRMAPGATANALGIAGSMASGIIEYLADGSWTKRMHAGWAAQSGLRAAAMGQAGFKGPATVFEGRHGFFRAFAPSVAPDLGLLTADLGERWESARVAFQAVRVRDDDPALRRLRNSPGEPRHPRRRHRRSQVLGGGGHRAAFVGTHRAQAQTAHGICCKVQHALLHRGGLPARRCRAWPSSVPSRFATPTCSRWLNACATRSIRTMSIHATTPAGFARR